ncbi:leucine zipper domain-containing protein [Nonomuraea sp. NPDC003804]|uniref:leucine zipper domain-containing protein n=1 Tax=Nonomuraea sp. NPDC003804 TaxID=3154547 RepID=UPI0033A7C7D0
MSGARQTLSRYRVAGLAGLMDRSRRPLSSPSQMSAEVETLVCELRRYGALRWRAAPRPSDRDQDRYVAGT